MDDESIEFYTSLYSYDFLMAMLEANQQQRMHKFYEFVMVLGRSGKTIPSHWTAFMAERLLAACDAKTGKSSNPVADALGIGKYQDESRDLSIGILVGYFLAIQEQDPEWSPLSVAKAARSTKEWMGKHGIQLSS